MQREPPAHRVAGERERGGRPGPATSSTHGGEVDRPQRRRGAVPAEVGRQRPVAFAREAARHLVPAAPGLREAVQQEERLGHRRPSCRRRHRHPPPAARVRRRARAAAGSPTPARRPARARTPIVLALVRERAPALPLASRRALRGVLRARPGQGERAAGRHHVHVGHRGRQPRARGDRGVRGPRAAASCSPPTARPSCATSAPGRRSTRSSSIGAAAKWFFEVGTHEATRERVRWMRALACRAVLDGARGAARARPPQLPAARAARPARGARPDEPLPGRAGRTALAAAHVTRSDATAAARGPRRRARGARRGVVVAGPPGALRRPAPQPRGFAARPRLAAAGRSARRRAPRRRRGRPLRRAAARRRRSPAAHRPDAGRARGRPADLQAPARVAGRRSATTCPRSRWTPRAPGTTRPATLRLVLATDPAPALTRR